MCIFSNAGKRSADKMQKVLVQLAWEQTHNPTTNSSHSLQYFQSWHLCVLRVIFIISQNQIILEISKGFHVPVLGGQSSLRISEGVLRAMGKVAVSFEHHSWIESSISPG